MVILCEKNVLSLINQWLDNYYQIQTKCYSTATMYSAFWMQLNKAEVRATPHHTTTGAGNSLDPRAERPLLPGRGRAHCRAISDALHSARRDDAVAGIVVGVLVLGFRTRDLLRLFCLASINSSLMMELKQAHSTACTPAQSTGAGGWVGYLYDVTAVEPWPWRGSGSGTDDP